MAGRLGLGPDALVVAYQVRQETPQDLGNDGILGTEVVVQRPGIQPDRVGDLADCGG